MPARFSASNSPLGLIRSLADRGDTNAQVLMAIMTGTYWCEMVPGDEGAATADTRRVVCQIRDQEGFAVPGIKDVVIRTHLGGAAAGTITMASGSSLTAATVATVAALPACTAAGTGVGKTLTANAVGALTIDGVAPTVNQRILVKNQVKAADNGVYTLSTVGDGSTAFILTRATDFDTALEMRKGLLIVSTAGTANAGKTWVHMTATAITVETTSLVFVESLGVTGGQFARLRVGTGTAIVWVQTDIDGQFIFDLLATGTGDVLIHATTDNGENELVKTSFA
jgi:hypothetical protein